MRVALIAVMLLACSDSDPEPTPAEPAPSPAPEPAPEDSEEAEAPEEPADEEVDEEEAGRAPEGPLAPALDSVRWGPDRREPEDTLDDLQELADAQFDGPTHIAGRFRARHGRERLSLVLVSTLSAEEAADAEDAEGMLEFGDAREGQEADEEESRVELEKRGPAENDTCRCEGSWAPTVHLMRVLHGDTPQVATVPLGIDFCSGLDFDMTIRDLDQDGRVELRLDIRYTTDVSCSARSEEILRMLVFDIADLAKQVSVPLVTDTGEYFSSSRTTTRARFEDLDEDGDRDLRIIGRSEISDEGEGIGDERAAVRQQWLYDPNKDVWERSVD